MVFGRSVLRWSLAAVFFVLAVTACVGHKASSGEIPLEIVSQRFENIGSLLDFYGQHHVSIKKGLVVQLKVKNLLLGESASEHVLFFSPPDRLRIDLLSPVGMTVGSSILKGSDVLVTWLPSENELWRTELCEYFNETVGICPKDIGLAVESLLAVMFGDAADIGFDLRRGYRAEVEKDGWVLKSKQRGTALKEAAFFAYGLLRRVMFERDKNRAVVEYRLYQGVAGEDVYFPSELRVYIHHGNRESILEVKLSRASNESINSARFELMPPLDVKKRSGMPFK